MSPFSKINFQGGQRSVHCHIMRIEVQDYSGISLLLEVPPGTVLLEIKLIVLEQLGVAPIHQCLIYKGSILEDDSTVEEVGFTDGDIVTLVLSKSVAPDKLEALQAELETELKEKLSKSNEFSEAKGKNPHLLTDFEIDEIVAMNLAMLASPDAQAQVHRLTDLALNNVERNPAAYKELIQGFKEVDDVDVDAFLGGEEAKEETVIPEKPTEPSCAPLPAMFFEDDEEVTYSSARSSWGFDRRGSEQLVW